MQGNFEIEISLAIHMHARVIIKRKGVILSLLISLWSLIIVFFPIPSTHAPWWSWKSKRSLYGGWCTVRLTKFQVSLFCFFSLFLSLSLNYNSITTWLELDGITHNVMSIKVDGKSKTYPSCPIEKNCTKIIHETTSTTHHFFIGSLKKSIGIFIVVWSWPLYHSFSSLMSHTRNCLESLYLVYDFRPWLIVQS